MFPAKFEPIPPLKESVHPEQMDSWSVRGVHSRKNKGELSIRPLWTAIATVRVNENTIGVIEGIGLTHEGLAGVKFSKRVEFIVVSVQRMQCGCSALLQQ